MDHFNYIDGHLHGDQVALADIAAHVGTPCYVYSSATLVDHYARLAEAFAELDPLICYAVKSCSNLAVLQTLTERGAGMDIVSGGELFRAVQAGVDPARCVFAGVGKTDREITEALQHGVGWFNVESEQEMVTLARIAEQIDAHCRVALRVNPDVDAHTHRKTTTGIKRAKFGVDLAQARAFFDAHGRNERCKLSGLHVHLGSPIYSPAPYVEALERINTVIDQLETDGHHIDMLDVGGGFGADYESHQTPDLSVYADALTPMLKPRVHDGMQLVLEPGRMIAANAGVLLLRVVYRKQSGDKTFIICDGGMNALMRPALYDAFHFIWPVAVRDEHVPLERRAEPDIAGLERVDIVGPICETGDILAENRLLPPVERGDLLAVYSAGAYGMSMANRYNSHPLPAEVLIDGDHWSICRQRETYEDLIRGERICEPAAVRS